jgi:predicted transposase YbfD/YdcC
MSSGLITIFREIRDPRQVNARHDLGDILFVALAAVLCGAKTCVEMAEFAESRLEVLREIVDLEHGAPSHDTFSRVFRLLEPEELRTAFSRCMGAIRQALGAPAPRGVVAIDGKSLRRAYDKGRAFMPPLMVNLFDSQTRLAISQLRAPGGSEVQGVLKLLAGLDLKGCMVTADALHCRSDTAQTIRDAKAHYALGLKGNQPLLLAAAEAAFAQAEDGLTVYGTKEQRHGRVEERHAAVLPAKLLASTYGFPALAAVGRIQAVRTGTNGKTTVSTRYVVLSKILTPKALLEVVRAHWSVENQLHWSLDVVFSEDDARSRKNHAPENLAVLRALALNIYRAHPDDIPPGRKMKRASWDKDFFFELFAHMR